MAAGDLFTAGQRNEIDKAIRQAEELCDLEFSVFVGRAESETRPFAERLHATLPTPRRSVLIMVDPAVRLLEVVTGPQAHSVLDDHQIELAVLTMKSAFAAGDLVGGITHGLQQLAQHAQRPPVRRDR